MFIVLYFYATPLLFHLKREDTKEILLKQRLQKELAANDESLFEYVRSSLMAKML